MVELYYDGPFAILTAKYTPPFELYTLDRYDIPSSAEIFKMRGAVQHVGEIAERLHPGYELERVEAPRGTPVVLSQLGEGVSRKR